MIGGSWKGIRQNLVPTKKMIKDDLKPTFALYDLAADVRDVVVGRPDIMAKMNS